MTSLLILNTSRKGWIDALRGMAMLLVVYGHSTKGLFLYYVFTSPVKMPLFFALSGYLLNVDRDVLSFLKNILLKIIIPWLCLALLPKIVQIPFIGAGQFFTYARDMFSGKELWFMPCFIFGELIHFFARKYCKVPWVIISVSFLLFGLGLVAFYSGRLNYLMINRALTVQPFFLIGYLFRENESRLAKLNWCWIGFFSVLYLVLCLISTIVYPGKTLDVHLCRYYNIPYCLFIIYLGCFLLLTFAQKANLYSRILCFIGQNTLVIYIWHGLSFGLLIGLYSFWGKQISFTWWEGIIKTVWACLICGGLAVLINNYFPELVGKKRKS